MKRLILLRFGLMPEKLSEAGQTLKGGWHSKDELVKQIMLYIKEYNKRHGHPSRWTSTGQALAA
jgi:hypothetical protein